MRKRFSLELEQLDEELTDTVQFLRLAKTLPDEVLIRHILLRAERAYLLILRAVCALTDREADAIEPKFTELEVELRRLSILVEQAARFRSRYN